MKYIRLTITNRGFTLLELMVVIAIIALLTAIAIPNFIAYRHKSYCSRAESDAEHIAAAIADYFGTATHTAVPAFNDLKITIQNHAVITGADPNIHITIEVTDSSNRCPLQYQDAHPGWNSNYVFTKEIR